MPLRITFIGSTNFLFFPAATGRRLQTPSFLGYNLREALNPQFSSYNQKEATTPYVLRLQPPVLSPPNHPDVEVEWLNRCHTITMRYTFVNLYQSTCTQKPIINMHHKQPVINLYHKQVDQQCTNLYHQQVHQSCTKYVPIMHQIHKNYDSSRCTKIIKYTPHVCANSSTTCLNHVPNMYLNQKPSSISSSKSDL